MTRKAARKRRQHAIKHPQYRQPATRTAVPWATVGALVASAAIGLRPSLVSAHQLPFNQDARLAVIDAALRSTSSLIPRPLGRLANQDQDGPSSTRLST